VAETSGLRAALRAECRDEAQFQRRSSHLEALADWLDGPAHGPGDLAAALALLAHADRGDPGEQVRLMSLHAAKGLEFRHVFIVGLEDGTLPHEASLDEGRLEEERRLFYVGITRARERLWLSHSEQAQRYGQRVQLSPSRFLDELPATDLQHDGRDPEADAARRAERASAGLDAIRALLGQ
jgi:ATP-dependent DNA helicase Rep